MKKSDFIFALCIVGIFLPFVLCETLYETYKSFNAAHGMVMSFIKFGVLSTMGEMLGHRISTGKYLSSTFGVVPRMVVWGILGMGINMAMIIFSKGTPEFLAYLGMENAPTLLGGEFCGEKIIVAAAISVAMNSIFAPVFMTLHKITDTHIARWGGSMQSLVQPIDMSGIISSLNWKVQWNFVFKKTIPFFWYPAHTITFLLPEEWRVLFAAVLGIVLGVILSVAARKGNVASSKK